MAKSKVFAKTSDGAGTVSLNMVPMVDVAFLLILFFILTSQIASQTYASMELSKPTNSQAVKKEKGANCVVINVVCMVNPNTKAPSAQLDLQAKEYSIDGTSFQIEDTPRLVGEIKRRLVEARKDGAKDFFVRVRADRRVAYSYVEPVLKAAAEAGVPKLDITAIEGT